MKTYKNAVAVLMFVLACGDSSAQGGGGSASGPAGPGAGPGPATTGTGAAGGESSTGGSNTGGLGGTGGSGAADCFLDPMVHVEIINGCTDSLKLDKAEQVGIWNEGDPLPALP